jgi:dipeptidyl aminopeptidase/acylaminoacyl peptidase
MEADIELWTGLTQRGVHVETLVFPDEDHGLSLWKSKVEALQAVVSFFDRNMTGVSLPQSTMNQ